MNLVEIADHTIDLDLLPERANILDGGCRTFNFSDPLIEMGHNVVGVDIDVLPDNKYHRCALSDRSGVCGVVNTADPQAMHIKEGSEIPMYTLEDFSKLVGVEWWDVLKLDVESSEYPIIMSLKSAPATQISLEMHIHTGAYGMNQAKEMEDKLISLGYEAVQHKLEERYCAGNNYWDSLFVLKK